MKIIQFERECMLLTNRLMRLICCAICKINYMFQFEIIKVRNQEILGSDLGLNSYFVASIKNKSDNTRCYSYDISKKILTRRELKIKIKLCFSKLNTFIYFSRIRKFVNFEIRKINSIQ